MKRFFLSIILIFFCFFSFAQDTSLKVTVAVVFNGKSIDLGKTCISDNKDTINFETIKFYLSAFKISSNENKWYQESKSYHLINLEEPESLHFELKSFELNTIKKIEFNVGVDSIASVSGAMDDDLDATKGMYWAWQSGFINLKIEGISTSCKTRKNKFQFHVGGYLEPFYALRKVKINVNKNREKNREIKIIADLAKLFQAIELSKTNTIMIPGKDALQIADLTSKIFSIE